jgi:Sec-independent protein translocase protein TatA
MPDTLLVLIVVLIVALVWRGPRNLPRIGEMLGRGVREARREAAATRDDFAHRDDDTPPETGQPRSDA